MSQTPVQYLLDRFRADGDALRARAVALRGGPRQPGPDADTSSRMATACDDVCAMLQAIPSSDDVSAMLASLNALVPLLEQRAANASKVPPLRAVYVGAATRIREVATAETNALAQHSAITAPDDLDLDDDFDGDDDDADDDDLHAEDDREARA